jgi:catechol-2,3-dioxygenase
VSVNTNGVRLDEVVNFYRDVLGLDDKTRPDIPGVAGHWHAVGDQELHVVAAAPKGTSVDPTGHHYCVVVADLAGAVAELEEREIPYEQAVQGEKTVQIWISDPAGNTIELQQETVAS